MKTRKIQVGAIEIGGDAPIVVQSMTTSDTMDIEKTVQQAKDLADAGCDLVRITAPTVQDAEALKTIRERLNQEGYSHLPLVADIHFLPAAAMVAADYVEKVRINPGNFADRKMFKTREYSDAEYQDELVRIHEKFAPLVLKLKSLGKALRIGTNHGSLSDRIMNRFGDTPEGMVESAFEFADICRQYDFHNFCFSMKASNVSVMVAAYRLLMQRQMERNWNYPIHLGVTEAGDGEDGRMKSAIGIGSLLQEGIGDTIRVSLTEAAVKEIPVARAIANRFPRTQKPISSGFHQDITASSSEAPLVVWKTRDIAHLKEELNQTSLRPDVIYFDDVDSISADAHLLKLQLKSLSGRADFKVAFPIAHEAWDKDRVRKKLLPLTDFFVFWQQEIPEWAKAIPLLRSVNSLQELKDLPSIDPQRILFEFQMNPSPSELDQIIDLSLQAGSAFVDLPLRAISVSGSSAEASLRYAYGILQATRRRMSKTEYISCPSCGRTLFDLEETTARIKAVTSHLKGVKIAVMGCIVNGPGEMADADFGYVGGAPGRVNLYVGKDCVERNIPSLEAPYRLVDLIKKHERWVEADQSVA